MCFFVKYNPVVRYSQVIISIDDDDLLSLYLVIADLNVYSGYLILGPLRSQCFLCQHSHHKPSCQFGGLLLVISDQCPLHDKKKLTYNTVVEIRKLLTEVKVFVEWLMRSWHNRKILVMVDGQLTPADYITHNVMSASSRSSIWEVWCRLYFHTVAPTG